MNEIWYLIEEIVIKICHAYMFTTSMYRKLFQIEFSYSGYSSDETEGDIFTMI
jgi:hypothetical protein